MQMAGGRRWAQSHLGLLCSGIHHQAVWVKLCPCQGWCCKCELRLFEFNDSITLHFSSVCTCINTWILFYIFCLIAKCCSTRGLWKYFEQVCLAPLSKLVWVQLLSLNTPLSLPFKETLIQLIFIELWSNAWFNVGWRRQWWNRSRAALKELLV